MDKLDILLTIDEELRHAVRDDNLEKKEVAGLILVIKEYFAAHWRDDDTPEFESGYGCG